MKLFVNADGNIRAGWRLSIFLLIFVFFGFVFNSAARFAVHHHWWAGPPKASNLIEPGVLIWREAFGFFLVLMATAVMSRIERRPLGSFGLPAFGAFGKLFWEGSLWGFASLTILLLMLRATGNFYFGSITLNGSAIFRYGLLWGIAFLLVGLTEEYLLRGYAQHTLASGIGFWAAATILSLAFGLLHYGNSGESFVGLLDVVLGGLMFSVTLWKTGNLWFAVGLHFSWDWAQSFFYGVPDSGNVSFGTLFTPSIPANRPSWLTGGTVGPEGSIFSCAVEVLLIVLILWRFRETRYQRREQTARVSAA